MNHKGIFLVALISVLVSQVGTAADSLKGTTIDQSARIQKLAVGLDDNQTPVYYALSQDGRYQMVNADVIPRLTESLIAQAKGIACNSSIRPETVSVSLELISATWDTHKLCEKKKR
jgi:hypothetical protein